MGKSEHYGCPPFIGKSTSSSLPWWLGSSGKSEHEAEGQSAFEGLKF
jgi:hypothetical protein